MVDIERGGPRRPSIDEYSAGGREAVLPYLQTQLGGEEWEVGEGSSHRKVVWDLVEIAMRLLL